MNRIYQGRVKRAELIDAKTRIATSPKNWAWESALWQHHVLFQDAVNYYVVCLLALAGPGSAVFSIREKLDAPALDASEDELMVWRRFPRRGALRRGLRDSVAKYLTPGNATPTPEECFTAVLAGNESAQSEEGRKRLDAGLTQLLRKCTGESGCRNSSKEYLPRFCRTKTKCNYPESAIALRRAYQDELLPFVLHSATGPDASELNAFNVSSIALPDYEEPRFSGDKAKEILLEMIKEDLELDFA